MIHLGGFLVLLRLAPPTGDVTADSDFSSVCSPGVSPSCLATGWLFHWGVAIVSGHRLVVARLIIFGFMYPTWICLTDTARLIECRQLVMLSHECLVQLLWIDAQYNLTTNRRAIGSLLHGRIFGGTLGRF